ALAKSLPVVISFLASLLGLGGIAGKIQAIFQKLRKPMEKAVDWVIDKGAKAFKKIGNKFNNSKFGKKFNTAKDAAKEKYQAGKQWVEDKKEAGKNWVEGKKQSVKDKLGFGKNENQEKANKEETSKDIQDKRTYKEKEQDLQAAVAQVKTLSQQPDANPQSIKKQLPSLKNTYRLKELKLIKIENKHYQVYAEINPSVTLDLPTLDSGDSAVEAKLNSLGFFKAQDVERIVTSLKKTGGGDAVGNYIKSGTFDGFKGYKDVLSSLKLKTEIPAILQAMNKGKALLDSGQKTIIFEEKASQPPHYDIDIGVVSPDGSFSLAYQLKYVEGNAQVSKNATKAAKQLKDAPAKQKWIEIQVHDGKWKSFEQEGREKGIKVTFKSEYPDINLKIIFSDGVEKIY
ncbi:MAG TPA: hypothetical protein V6D25_29265, partial [Leptolyngbyaceae cyanobacterium]